MNPAGAVFRDSLYPPAGFSIEHPVHPESGYVDRSGLPVDQYTGITDAVILFRAIRPTPCGRERPASVATWLLRRSCDSGRYRYRLASRARCRSVHRTRPAGFLSARWPMPGMREVCTPSCWYCRTATPVRKATSGRTVIGVTLPRSVFTAVHESCMRCARSILSFQFDGQPNDGCVGLQRERIFKSNLRGCRLRSRQKRFRRKATILSSSIQADTFDVIKPGSRPLKSIQYL